MHIDDRPDAGRTKLPYFAAERPQDNGITAAQLSLLNTWEERKRAAYGEGAILAAKVQAGGEQPLSTTTSDDSIEVDDDSSQPESLMVILRIDPERLQALVKKNSNAAQDNALNGNGGIGHPIKTIKNTQSKGATPKETVQPSTTDQVSDSAKFEYYKSLPPKEQLKHKKRARKELIKTMEEKIELTKAIIGASEASAAKQMSRIKLVLKAPKKPELANDTDDATDDRMEAVDDSQSKSLIVKLHVDAASLQHIVTKEPANARETLKPMPSKVSSPEDSGVEVPAPNAQKQRPIKRAGDDDDESDQTATKSGRLVKKAKKIA